MTLNSRDNTSFLLANFTALTLFIFLSLEIMWLVRILFISLHSGLLYEDSFALISPPISHGSLFLGWLFDSHNGHLILIPKLFVFITSVLTNTPPAFFNILFSFLFLVAGCFAFIWYFCSYSLQNKFTLNLLLICLILWLSPYSWENYIWEFQFGFYLISLLTLVAVCFLRKYFIFLASVFSKGKLTYYRQSFSTPSLLERVFLLVSPSLAFFTSGQGYIFAFVLSSFFLFCCGRRGLVLLSLTPIVIYLFVSQLLVSGDFGQDSLSSFAFAWHNVSSFILYVVAALNSSVFSASVDAFNPSSYLMWILPMISSFLFLTTLIFSIFYCIRYLQQIGRHVIPNVLESGSLLPLCFGFLFLLAAAYSRSSYGFHQGLVSRYYIIKIFIPIGLIMLFNSLSHNLFASTFASKSRLLFNFPAAFFAILLLLNYPSFLSTIYDSALILVDRQSKFSDYISYCPGVKIRYHKFSDDYLRSSPSNLKNTLKFASRDIVCS